MEKILKTTFHFYRNDDAPYVGAYAVNTLTKGEPTIMFNMEAVIEVIKDEEEKAAGFKEILLQTITHEFCHSMQEWLNKEFDELEVEKILGAYNEKWNVFNAEIENPEDAPVFSIPEFLERLDDMQLDPNFNGHYHSGASMMKDQIKGLFAPYVLWQEAEKRDAEEKASKK